MAKRGNGAREILFLMAAATKQFPDMGERLWRLRAAYELLSGHKATGREIAVMRKELAR